MPKTIEVDLALIPSSDALLNDRALFTLQTAKPHAPHTLYLLHTVPGMGTMLSLVLLYAIHHIERFPSVQEFASSGRLVTCSKASRVANGWERLARQLVMPISHGPFPKPPRCASATTRPNRTL